jgi:hypothetical protein
MYTRVNGIVVYTCKRQITHHIGKLEVISLNNPRKRFRWRVKAINYEAKRRRVFNPSPFLFIGKISATRKLSTMKLQYRLQLMRLPKILLKF